jgi:hypothetical protein
LKKQERTHSVGGKTDLTSMDRWTAKFSRNRPFLKAYLGAIRMLFKVFSLPGIQESHPWASEKHTHGVMLPISEELNIVRRISSFVDIT